MRSFALVFVLIGFILSCKQKDHKSSLPLSNTAKAPEITDSTQYTTIQWKESTVHYEKITEGQNLEVSFHFTNTGDKPLIIYKVAPGCGCTVAETPTEPILPGREGVIKATFDSRNRTGTQHKSIFVGANTKGKQEHELVFEVEVEKSS